MRIVSLIAGSGMALALTSSMANGQFLQNVSLVVNPASPRPGSTIAVQAVLVGENSADALFEWYLNGRLLSAESGRGKDRISFSLGGAARTVVDVVVISENGTRFSASRTITASQAVIVWWTDTSVPPWFRGKAVPSPASTVTIHALPGPGFEEPASALLYNWSVNAEQRPEISGAGRDKFTLRVSLAPDTVHQVTVRITNRERTITQEATLLMPIKRPELLVYQLTPAGLPDFSKTVSAFTGEAGKTFDFTAIPFFFRRDQLEKPAYEWGVNGRALTGDFSKPNVLTIKTSLSPAEQQNILVVLRGSQPNQQEASAAFTASFIQP